MKVIVMACAATIATGAAAAGGSVERGEYLVRGPMGCGNCHTPIGPNGFEADRELAGRLVMDIPEMTAISANITPGGRVAKWTDAELGRAIREGVRPDGTLIGPPMPFMMYRHISDSDLASIVAFLRTVPAVEGDPGKSTFHIPLPPAYGPPIASVAAPEPGVTVEWGAYMVNLAHCMECHSRPGPMGVDLETGLGQGGFQFPGPWGVSVAPNITPSADGIAGFSDDDLRKMITTGTRPDGSAMLPPMPYPFLANMTAQDLDAIILYLRSIPPLPDAG